MKHSLVSDQLHVSINFAGAEINSIKNNSGIEFIWQAKQEVWPRHAPVLFPIVGKLKNNRFFFDNTEYELGQHGFARDKTFELVENKGSSCTFQLSSDESTKKSFPFDFIFQIKYELLGNKLITHYNVINSSSEAVFFSVGAHPGFNCPLLENETFEDYYLEFPSSHYLLTDLDNGLRKQTKQDLELSQNKLYLSEDLFSKDALVFENNQIDRISLCSGKSDHKITLECSNWPYFGVWSKKGCREFVCLEPWYGIADIENSSQRAEDKQGFIKLDAKKSFQCSFSLIFE